MLKDRTVEFMVKDASTNDCDCSRNVAVRDLADSHEEQRSLLDHVVCFQFETASDGIVIILKQKENGFWYIWDESRQYHLDRNGDWHHFESSLHYWETCKFFDYETAIAALKRHRHVL